MFTAYFQFHKPCLNGFSELEMESAMNVLEAIKTTLTATSIYSTLSITDADMLASTF